MGEYEDAPAADEDANKRQDNNRTKERNKRRRIIDN